MCKYFNIALSDGQLQDNINVILNSLNLEIANPVRDDIKVPFKYLLKANTPKHESIQLLPSDEIALVEDILARLDDKNPKVRVGIFKLGGYKVL